MNLLQKLVPNLKSKHKEKDMIDKRVDAAVEHSKVVEDRIRKLAMTYRAEAIVLKQVRTAPRK